MTKAFGILATTIACFVSPAGAQGLSGSVQVGGRVEASCHFIAASARAPTLKCNTPLLRLQKARFAPGSTIVTIAPTI